MTVDTSWLEFGYDQSKLQNQEYFVINATFQLKKVDPLTSAFARGRSVEITRHRQKRYPYQNTCGSFFRNFHPHEVAHTEKKLIYVAYYLDQLGVKGQLSVGGAIVSHQHANMIVNHKQGSSQDILNLTLMLQDMVYKAYGMKPQPECQLIGFTTNPFA
jgi:UDP-N-acetylmuramate dehydrogenase